LIFVSLCPISCSSQTRSKMRMKAMGFNTALGAFDAQFAQRHFAMT
jgi:hypothetical protein